ncbi:MAG: hypothetical protein EXR72_07560 [Myxococcales bacterium]|nr:hypothetical protein [Myxococcales bacterium]
MPDDEKPDQKPPPARNVTTLRKDAQSNAAEAFATLLTSVHRAKQALPDQGKGLPRSLFPKGFEPSALIHDLVKRHLQVQTQLLALGNELLGQIHGGPKGQAPGAENQKPPKPGGAGQIVTLSGHAGKQAKAEFPVKNPLPVAVTPLFKVTPFGGPNGLFDLLVDCDSKPAPIPPKGTAELTLVVSLKGIPPGHYEAKGVVYRAGQGASETIALVTLQLDVLP